MHIHRTILLTLAFLAGASAAFAQIPEAGSPFPVVAGSYKGLLTGSAGNDLVLGQLTARVAKSGAFTAGLELGGSFYPLAGTFVASGSNGGSTYSTIIKSGSGGPIAVSLAFSGTAPGLTGTVTQAGNGLLYTGGLISNTSSAGGFYRFIIGNREKFDVTLGEQPLTAIPFPEGTGYGDMTVHANGLVTIVGRLPDGTAFATESLVTSGSNVPIYIHMGTSLLGGLGGTLTFEDIPNTSDCDGVLFWTKAPNAKFPDGFRLPTEFQASQFDRVIGGLNGDVVSFEAIGDDLAKPVTASIPLTLDGNLDLGASDKVHLTISRTKNTFFGSFVDTKTNLRRPFAGVILTKSRTGAGLFFSEGSSGTVMFNY